MPEQSTASTNNQHDAVTVLLVEDDPATLRFYSEALRISGFNVLAASTGSDALAKARARMPDAVVADLGLPDFDGFEVCRQLKLQPGAEHLAAIALTGRSMALRDIDLAERAGFASVLLKPSTPEAIAAAIAAARRRQGSGRAPVSAA